MYLIVGLGNPEEEYAKTRHNMGFNTINEIAKKYDISMNRKKFDALYGDGIIEGKKAVLLKPQTYMNLSGTSIIQWVEFYKLKMEDIILIYDDIDIEPGMIKIKKKGGPGTHNGMKSVVHELNSDEFARVRVGIGTPENKQNLIEYVIGAISEEDNKKLDEGVQKAAQAVVEILKSGIDKAMNQFN